MVGITAHLCKFSEPYIDIVITALVKRSVCSSKPLCTYTCTCRPI